MNDQKVFSSVWFVALISALAAATVTSGVNIIVTQRTLNESRLSFLIGRQENIARELLSEALNVMSLKEAWILQGKDSQTAKLTELPPLSETPSETPWLMSVEVRAVLDEAQWNPSTDGQALAFLNGRRAWIVRNEVRNLPLAYNGGTKIHYPALLSSKGAEELSGWIERVRLSYIAGRYRRMVLRRLGLIYGL
jgi:hypothetical protein